MKKMICGLWVAVIVLVFVAAAAGGCTLDRSGQGLFGPGTGGEAGTMPDAGNGGDAGAGGNAGEGGSAGAGGVAGNGGEAGAGGNAGEGGSAGAGGVAGNGGEAGAGGNAGAGGQAGYPTCIAGDPDTVDIFSANGQTMMRALLHDWSGIETFYTSNQTNTSISGKPMPGQLIVLGQDSINFDLKLGMVSMAKTYYQVDLTVLPPACSGMNTAAEECLSAVAKSFRCQFSPYNESLGCPPSVNFTSQGTASSWGVASSGYTMILVDLTCP